MKKQIGYLACGTACLALAASLTLATTMNSPAADAPSIAQSTGVTTIDITEPRSQAAPTSVADVAPSSTSSTPLEGGVQKVTVSLETLRDVGLDLKRLLKEVSGLYDEVTIRPVRMITQPEMIGPGMIINIPIGTQPIGPAEPPKKERVDLAMSEITPVVTMMKKNVDAFVAGDSELDLSADVQKQLQPEITSWVNSVNQLSAQFNALQQQTQGPPYSNDNIAAATGAMQTSIKELDKTRRDIYKAIRNEGKRKRFF